MDVNFSDLAEISQIQGTEVMPIENPTTTLKTPASKLKTYMIGSTDISGIGDGSVTGAISANATNLKNKVITLSNVSELPQTVSNADITSDMKCIHAEFSNSSAYVDATVTTSTGSLTITGTISGTTNIELTLAHTR